MGHAVVEAPRVLKAMEVGDYFVLSIACLQLGAALCFMWKRRWLEAALYASFMVGSFTILAMTLSRRHGP